MSTEFGREHATQGARSIAAAWESLVWAVEDEAGATAMMHLRSLSGTMGEANRDVMAPYCRALERHLERHGFEGLTPLLYEFHLRIQAMMDEARLAADQHDG